MNLLNKALVNTIPILPKSLVRVFANKYIAGDNIGEELRSIMPAISFRPTAQTVFRLNYRYQWQRDILDNAPSKTAGFSFGISSYF